MFSAHHHRHHLQYIPLRVQWNLVGIGACEIVPFPLICFALHDGLNQVMGFGGTRRGAFSHFDRVTRSGF